MITPKHLCEVLVCIFPCYSLIRLRGVCYEFFLNCKLNEPFVYKISGRLAHLLEDKQIPSVGRFDVVSFYTLFRVHLTLNSGIYAPKRYLIVPFRVFYSRVAKTWKMALLDAF